MSIVRNISKTVNYGKKNGYKEAAFAAWERLTAGYYKNYTYVEPDAKILEEQRKGAEPILFSIVVPAFETPSEYLSALIDSCLEQTYSNFELILADGSASSIVEDTVKKYHDDRIIYQKLEKNGGISDNSNEGIKLAKGQYCCLLDHDDLLTKDALYEVAKAIMQAKEEPVLLYSDEDKCDETATRFYDPHMKLDFNFDLLLTNNYICHLTVVKTELLSYLQIRKQFDGAQDYDLVLRVVSSLFLKEKEGFGKKIESHIVHIPKVLYHWRCHNGSTADNPGSKMYAYEAGRKALADFTNRVGWKGDIRHNKHLGFYRIAYRNDVLSHRDDLAAVGGLVSSKGKVVSGPYKGMPLVYAGYMNRMDLYQNVNVLDIRNLAVNKHYQRVYEELTGHPYVSTFAYDKNAMPDWIEKLSKEEIENLNKKLSKQFKQSGARLLLDPESVIKI